MPAEDVTRSYLNAAVAKRLKPETDAPDDAPEPAAATAALVTGATPPRESHQRKMVERKRRVV